MEHVLSVLHALVPFVPAVVITCLAYLAANDALDVALVVKREQRKTQFSDVMTALTNDIANRQVVAGVLTATFPVLAGGGDIKALAVAAIVGVAAANVGNLEASTRSKVRELFAAAPEPARLLDGVLPSRPIPLPTTPPS